MAVIEADGLVRTYAKRNVVDGVDLRIDEGQVHALLGPNGSGKTTTVRMLATLARPSAGHARILGFDTIREPTQVKRSIGLVGQFHAVDPRLTGFENLTMFARMSGFIASAARQHATELLERFELTEAADVLAGRYSGGMRRRLDIVAGMVVRPAVLFLDEPTTGLDPRSRNQIYGYIKEFVSEGTTVLLTTQYLDEADRLADAITILDTGRVVAAGTPDEITAALGTGLDLVVSSTESADEIARILARFGGRPADSISAHHDSTMSLSFAFDDPDIPLLPVLRALDEAAIEVHDIGHRRATLDDAFLALTGRTTERSSA